MSAAPAAPPTVFPLPADPAAALDDGRAVRFRHPRTGAEFRVVPASPPADDPADLPFEEGRRMQIEIDGGEITESEALRRALAFNEAEAAADRGPLTNEEFWAGIERDFPELRGIAARADAGAAE